MPWKHFYTTWDAWVYWCLAETRKIFTSLFKAGLIESLVLLCREVFLETFHVVGTLDGNLPAFVDDLMLNDGRFASRSTWILPRMSSAYQWSKIKELNIPLTVVNKPGWVCAINRYVRINMPQTTVDIHPILNPPYRLSFGHAITSNKRQHCLTQNKSNRAFLWTSQWIVTD